MCSPKDWNAQKGFYFEELTAAHEISTVSQDIVDEFAFFEDWLDRYEHLIDLGRELPILDNAFRTDEYRIRGCQAQVWLHPSRINGLIYFTADSDAMITKGLIALLIRVLDGRTGDEIVNADLSFLDAIGMKEHLSPTRKNGLDAMIKQIKLYALALSSQANQS